MSEPFFSAKGGKGQVGLAQEMLQLIPMDALTPYGPWQLVSEMVMASPVLAQSSNRAISMNGDGVNDDGTPLGLEYRDVVRVLERGLRSTPNLPWDRWQTLFLALSERVRGESGDAGLALCVVEPLAKLAVDLNSLGTETTTNRLKATIEMLSAATQPRDRQAVESAKRRLWGTTMPGPRLASFDPFDNLYKLVDWSLRFLYDHLEQYDAVEIIAPLIKEVGAFFDRGNSRLFVKTLVALQGGIACWIQDEQTQLNSRQSTAASESVSLDSAHLCNPFTNSRQTKLLWDTICARLGSLYQADTLPLDAVEPLLCAAFESKHHHMVNAVSTLWNKLFDDAEEIAYPERLKATLVSRQSFVNLALPGLEASSVESGAQQPVLIDSQRDMDVLTISSTKTGQRMTPRPSPSGQHGSPLVFSQTPGTKRRRDATPSSSAPKAVPQGAAHRLRHDDSQIQFAPIVPAPVSDNSAIDSQALTERQREVRERQRETGGLYREIQPRPAAAMSGSPSRRAATAVAGHQELPKQRRATTPDAEPDSDHEFITSTPTPRRGQALTIGGHDADMADPPSSPPPEARRYLLPEISSSNILDRWQFSSPAGSPAAAVRPPANGISEFSPGSQLQQPLADVDEASRQSSAVAVESPRLLRSMVNSQSPH